MSVLPSQPHTSPMQAVHRSERPNGERGGGCGGRANAAGGERGGRRTAVGKFNYATGQQKPAPANSNGNKVVQLGQCWVAGTRGGTREWGAPIRSWVNWRTGVEEWRNRRQMSYPQIWNGSPMSVAYRRGHKMNAAGISGSPGRRTCLTVQFTTCHVCRTVRAVMGN